MGADGVFARKGGGCAIVNLRLRDMDDIPMRLRVAAQGAIQSAVGAVMLRANSPLPFTPREPGIAGSWMALGATRLIYPARTREFTHSAVSLTVSSAEALGS